MCYLTGKDWRRARGDGWGRGKEMIISLAVFKGQRESQLCTSGHTGWDSHLVFVMSRQSWETASLVSEHPHGHDQYRETITESQKHMGWRKTECECVWERETRPFSDVGSKRETLRAPALKADWIMGLIQSPQIPSLRAICQLVLSCHKGHKLYLMASDAFH